MERAGSKCHQMLDSAAEGRQPSKLSSTDVFHISMAVLAVWKTLLVGAIGILHACLSQDRIDLQKNKLICSMAIFSFLKLVHIINWLLAWLILLRIGDDQFGWNCIVYYEWEICVLCTLILRANITVMGIDCFLVRIRQYLPLLKKIDWLCIQIQIASVCYSVCCLPFQIGSDLIRKQSAEAFSITFDMHIVCLSIFAPACIIKCFDYISITRTAVCPSAKRPRRKPRRGRAAPSEVEPIITRNDNFQTGWNRWETMAASSLTQRQKVVASLGDERAGFENCMALIYGITLSWRSRLRQYGQCGIVCTDTDRSFVIEGVPAFVNSRRLANVLQMIDPTLTDLDGAIRIALPLQDASGTTEQLTWASYYGPVTPSLLSFIKGDMLPPFESWAHDLHFRPEVSRDSCIVISSNAKFRRLLAALVNTGLTKREVEQFILTSLNEVLRQHTLQAIIDVRLFNQRYVKDRLVPNSRRRTLQAVAVEDDGGGFVVCSNPEHRQVILRKITTIPVRLSLDSCTGLETGRSGPAIFQAFFELTGSQRDLNHVNRRALGLIGRGAALLSVKETLHCNICACGPGTLPLRTASGSQVQEQTTLDQMVPLDDSMPRDIRRILIEAGLSFDAKSMFQAMNELDRNGQIAIYIEEENERFVFTARAGDKMMVNAVKSVLLRDLRAQGPATLPSSDANGSPVRWYDIPATKTSQCLPQSTLDDLVPVNGALSGASRDVRLILNNAGLKYDFKGLIEAILALSEDGCISVCHPRGDD